MTEYTSPWFPAGLELDLEDALNAPVHVLTEGSFRPENLRQALDEAIPL